MAYLGVHGHDCSECGARVNQCLFKCDACGREEDTPCTRGPLDPPVYPAGWVLVGEPGASVPRGLERPLPVYCSWTCLARVAVDRVEKERA